MLDEYEIRPFLCSKCSKCATKESQSSRIATETTRAKSFGCKLQTAMSFITVEAATVVCLRRRPGGSPGSMLKLGSLSFPDQWWSRLPATMSFEHGWEVLMGQSECVNWLRSTLQQQVVMRYAGEFKFAGGGAEEGDCNLRATAERELREEYMLGHLPPGSIKLHPFNVKQTKPIKGRSYVMHNFVALAHENPWLADPALTTSTNRVLQLRRDRFAAALESGTFWCAAREEREKLAPEVRVVEWVDMKQACWMLLTSKSEQLTPVNEFQQTEFARLGVTTRDPMFQTFATLSEIEAYRDEAALLSFCDSFGAEQQSAAAAEELARFSKKHSLTEPKEGQEVGAATDATSKL